jgi:hypothetical protein
MIVSFAELMSLNGLSPGLLGLLAESIFSHVTFQRTLAKLQYS